MQRRPSWKNGCWGGAKAAILSRGAGLPAGSSGFFPILPPFSFNDDYFDFSWGPWPTWLERLYGITSQRMSLKRGITSRTFVCIWPVVTNSAQSGKYAKSNQITIYSLVLYFSPSPFCMSFRLDTGLIRRSSLSVLSPVTYTEGIPECTKLRIHSVYVQGVKHSNRRLQTFHPQTSSCVL